jgi:hypothetical protein
LRVIAREREIGLIIYSFTWYQLQVILTTTSRPSLTTTSRSAISRRNALPPALSNSRCIHSAQREFWSFRRVVGSVRCDVPPLQGEDREGTPSSGAASDGSARVPGTSPGTVPSWGEAPCCGLQGHPMAVITCDMSRPWCACKPQCATSLLGGRCGSCTC